jgi:lipopolysaccharide transport system ATP-binding protein
MKRWEISKYFDEIVAFAGVEQFLHIPVKKYSSGMRLRLAFAVAAYLRPEILLIDEVLAVGDYEFEKKCIESMGELGKAGRTILFVSHNLVAIKKLCSRVLVLKNGEEQFLGDPIQAVAAHLGTKKITSSSITWAQGGLLLGTLLALRSVKIISIQGSEQEQFLLSESVAVAIFFDRFDRNRTILFLVSFYDELDTLLFSSSKVIKDYQMDSSLLGEQLLCTVPAHIFQEGIISLGLEIFDLGMDGALSDVIDAFLFSEERLLSFVMKESEVEKKTRRDGLWNYKKPKIKPYLEWR